MEGEFGDRYRVASARLINWDYSDAGVYFVTICVFNHNKLLGKMIGKKMVLSRAGEIVKGCWREIPKHFDNLAIEDFIVMPNHLHGIIRINKKRCRDAVEGCRDVACNVSTKNNNANNVNKVKHCRDVACNVSTNNTNIENNANNKFMSMISPKNGSLPVIIRSFKSAVKYRCNQEHLFFAWQSRYHDEVIRDEEKVLKIRWYIRNNVKNWVKDKWYSK